MNQWIALFRGINVGGHHRLPMKDLTRLLDEAGCENVATYIQSGNVVFAHRQKDAQKLSQEISRRIDDAFGFAPSVFLMTTDDLAACAAENPFADAVADPKTLHVAFLSTTPSAADIGAMESLLAAGEAFKLTDKCFYLHAADGIGRSKLAAKAERLLGVTTTTRNWRTVVRLLDMARKQQEPAGTGS